MKHIIMLKKSNIERVAIVLSNGRTMAQVQAAEKCDYIINGGLYDTKAYKPVSLLKVDGNVLASEPWGAWGYAWNVGPDIEMRSIPGDADGFENYVACVALLTPWDGINAKLSYPAALGGVRGRTAIALTDDSLILYCSKDGTGDAKTPEALRKELYNMGVKTALMLDSGGSSQCIFGAGETIKTGRNVQNYICVWTKKNTDDNRKEDDTMSKKPIVCLDPGHGPDTGNASPDGTYKEQEFAWDMGQRLYKLLEQQGIIPILTRSQDIKPSLTERANVSNKAKADLFVSIHTNAANDSGWSSPHGLLIYTSMSGESAKRNILARRVLDRMKEAGVAIQGSGLAHYGYTVLTKTTAPAILIEYGFHTNREDVERLKDSAYRDKLSQATVQGICDYLGMEYKAPVTSAWYTEAQKWATSNGISDGTRPTDPCTRAEVWEMIKNYEKLH